MANINPVWMGPVVRPRGDTQMDHLVIASDFENRLPYTTACGRRLGQTNGRKSRPGIHACPVCRKAYARHYGTAS